MAASKGRTRKGENRQVFINCPFSSDYREKFRAIVFTVMRSGFTPRCTLEADDGAENRFEKICVIVSQCRLGVHDISKTELDATSRLPRFNMPLELGLFLGARKFGVGDNSQKRCIILDRKPYRYQKFISDISGQDIHSHSDKTAHLVEKIASWLREEANEPNVPGGRLITGEFRSFGRDVPRICAELKLHPDELTFQDYRKMAERWIVAKATH